MHRRLLPLQDWFTTYDPSFDTLRMVLRLLMAFAFTGLGVAILTARFGLHSRYLIIGFIMAMVSCTSVAERTFLGRLRTTSVALLLALGAAGLGVWANVSPLPYVRELLFIVVAGVSSSFLSAFARGRAWAMALFMSYYFVLYAQVGLAGLGWVSVALALGCAASLLAFAFLPSVKPEALLLADVRVLKGRGRQFLRRALRLAGEADAPVDGGLWVALERFHVAIVEVATHLERFEGLPEYDALHLELVGLERLARRLYGFLERLEGADREALSAALGALRQRLRQQKAPEQATWVRFLRAYNELKRALRAFELPEYAYAAPQKALAVGPQARQPARQVWQSSLQGAGAAAIAIFFGELFSPTTWYWAAITAFVVFIGTRSRGDVFVKSGERALGTVLGVLAGALTAYLLHGNLLLIVLALALSLFVAFYFLRLSYSIMIFHVTIFIALAYSLSANFTVKLEHRLIETIIGAVAGVVAAFIFFPRKTQQVFVQANRAYLARVQGVLTALEAALIAPQDTTALRHALWALTRAYQELRDSSTVLRRNPFQPERRRGARHYLRLVLALDLQLAACLSAMREVTHSSEAELALLRQMVQLLQRAASRLELPERAQAEVSQSEAALRVESLLPETPLAAGTLRFAEQLRRVEGSLQMLQEFQQKRAAA